MQNKPVNEQEIGKQLLFETVSYAESSVCRVRQLLNYFGEEMTEDCGNCDNCLNPKPKFEGKEDILTILETIRITSYNVCCTKLLRTGSGFLTPYQHWLKGK